jgi:hypothetical protein
MKSPVCAALLAQLVNLIDPLPALLAQLVNLIDPSPAAAAPSREELDRVLGGVEHAATAEEVRALGPSADQILIAVASDETASRWGRRRAVLALRYAPSAAAQAFLLELLRARAGAPQDGEADLLELAAALAALAPYGRAAAGTILPFVAHRSADVRQNAAAALALTGAPEADGALAARFAVERDPGVRRVVARSLRALRLGR